MKIEIQISFVILCDYNNYYYCVKYMYRNLSLFNFMLLYI